MTRIHAFFFSFFFLIEKRLQSCYLFLVFFSVLRVVFIVMEERKKILQITQCDEFQQCLKNYRNFLIQLQGSFASRSSFHLKKKSNMGNYGTERLYSQRIPILFCRCCFNTIFTPLCNPMKSLMSVTEVFITWFESLLSDAIFWGCLGYPAPCPHIWPLAPGPQKIFN